MRHEVVQRTAIVLTLVLLGASLLFAWSVGASGTAHPSGEGADVFTRRCGQCHDPAEVARPLAGARDRGLAVLEFLGFLEGHTEAPQAETRAIARHLLELR